MTARTALNAEAGARTPFSNLVTGAFILLTLCCLSPWLSNIPMAVLVRAMSNAQSNTGVAPTEPVPTSCVSAVCRVQ